MEWDISEISPLFAESISTPNQYYNESRDDSQSRPIKRLMLAVLEDALRCLNKYAHAKSGAHRLLYREAEQWLGSRDSYALFSFILVCETLGIEPEYLRSGVLQWRQMRSLSDTRPHIARRSPVVRNGTIVSANSGCLRRGLSRRRRDHRHIPVT
jgi:hypothetical protein